jgi:hypothetical protein
MSDMIMDMTKWVDSGRSGDITFRNNVKAVEDFSTAV